VGRFRMSCSGPVLWAIKRISGTRMARNMGSMLLYQGGRAGLQAVYFVLVARALGVNQFGAFAGAAALVAILQPFGSLGTINLLIMHVGTDRSTIARQFSTATFVTGVSGFCLGLLLFALSPWVAPHGVGEFVLFEIVVADLLGARLVDIAGAVYQAQDRMFRTALYPLVLYGARVLGAIALVLAPVEMTLSRWAFAYCLCSLAVTVPLLVYVGRDVGFVRPDIRGYGREWKLGLQFSVSLFAQSVYNDIDKAMLSRWASLEATGIYAAAYRLVDLAFMPMRALLSASYTRFFQRGTGGLSSTVALARAIAKPGIPYCLAASGLLFAGAGIVPVLLGSSYATSVNALRWLSILPLLKCIHYLAADALTGARLQSVRTAWQVGVAVANVVLNAWLIPAYSWKGAVIASLLSDGVLAVALWCAVWRHLRLERGSRRPLSLSGD
jgi:O-antigen/teichoic acid export membrane protein